MACATVPTVQCTEVALYSAPVLHTAALPNTALLSRSVRAFALSRFEFEVRCAVAAPLIVHLHSCSFLYSIYVQPYIYTHLYSSPHICSLFSHTICTTAFCLVHCTPPCEGDKKDAKFQSSVCFVCEYPKKPKTHKACSNVNSLSLFHYPLTPSRTALIHS